ncbi:interferon phi 2 isoform X1 [Phycodurus eques]|uniref:interferon phi 2 isoform X1 n=1 Tax=Phycodurus eques TaxID=693459 RepID=UPI002ACE7C8B|nr:interferon phi 2 isoform X1 [Phycodurus eques]XP_061557040.1 interferon phi 2 isoform X1 [Phycodurus eques]
MIVALVVLVLRLGSVHVMTAAVPVCSLPENVVLEAHNLLRDLGALFPVHCLPYNANVTFPCTALTNATQCRQTLRALHQALRGAEQVFQDNDLPHGEGAFAWDQQKLDYFQNLQNRLVRDGGCLSAGALSDPHLSSYFGNVTSLLQQQDSAICGWSLLRRDVLWVLNTALRRHRSCFR